VAPVQADDSAIALWVPFAAYQELVRDLVALRRDGFVPRDEVVPPTLVPDLPTAVTAAITALGVDPQTARGLREEARALLRAGTPEDQVARRITDGEEVEL